MPLGGEGDITLIDDKAFGFFDVIVKAPDFIQHPIIQTRVKTSGGIRTISPLGTWRDVIFSEEIYNAMNYGYTFQVLRGYLFDKQIIFDNFIHDLYEMKAAVEKSDPIYLISKLLQNSNYGRWSLNYEHPEYSIVDDIKFDELNRNKNLSISNPIELSPNKKLLGLTDNLKYKNLDKDDSKFKYKVSLPIAAAITAYARIFMSQFKNNPDIKLLYTDTDSLFIVGELPSYLIGNKLGQFKLEHTFLPGKCVILSPKVYGGILSDGSEIIKIKGLKKDSIHQHLTFDMLKSLLNRNSSLEIPNSKMIRNFDNRSINIRKDLYSLMINENKRKILYNNNIFSNTESYVIDINKNFL